MFSMKADKEHKNIVFHSVVKAIEIGLVLVMIFGALIMYFKYNADFSFGVFEAFQVSLHLEKDEAGSGSSVELPEENYLDQSNG